MANKFYGKKVKIPTDTILKIGVVKDEDGTEYVPDYSDMWAMLELYRKQKRLPLYVPFYIAVNDLFTSTGPKTLNAVAYTMCKEAGVDVLNGTWATHLDLLDVTFFWVVACWKYRYFNGYYPRMRRDKGRHITTKLFFSPQCPWCNKVFVPNGIYDSERWRNYFMLLVEHATDYHRWDVKDLMAELGQMGELYHKVDLNRPE